MFSLFGQPDDEQLGVIVDVTAREVSIAVLSSKESDKFPRVFWYHQERVLALGSSAPDNKSLRLAIQKAFAELSKVGFAVLRKNGITYLPEIIQASISAPLSYTVSKNLRLAPEKPVRVTKKLLAELEAKAAAETKAHSTSKLMAKDLNLVALANFTAGLRVNGYPTHYPEKSEATEIVLCQMMTLAERDLVAELESQRDKMMPKARLDVDSYMSVYLRALMVAVPSSKEACLLCLMPGQGEMMLVRDSLPLSSLAAKTDIGLVPNDPAFQQSLTELFKQTGDGLSMPRTIFVHARGMDGLVIKASLETAAKAATGINHQVVVTDAELFASDSSIPPFLAILSFVFHHDLYEERYLDEYKNMLK